MEQWSNGAQFGDFLRPGGPGVFLKAQRSSAFQGAEAPIRMSSKPIYRFIAAALMKGTDCLNVA
jgi:hypothetical protein